MLVDGVWKDVWYDTETSGGRFVRQDSRFRSHVEASADAAHPAVAGRYLLYVSLACPWAHRTLIVRALKGLESAIPIAVVHPLMLDQGWTFEDGSGCIPDPLFGASRLYEIYQRADAHYSGRVTVPVLWDREVGTIVNNESSELLRQFNTAFDAFATRAVPDLYPEALREEIDAVNQRIYDTVNNGVYKAGFATRQAVYAEAVEALFDTLDWLDQRLNGRQWLVGEQLTEADIRLFTTLIRFDAVYHGHFKCNLRRIVDYPALQAYTRRIHALPGVAATVNFDHIKRHYYGSHRTINPTGIVPVGPILDFDTDPAH